jgi:hypothetical protein
MLLLGAFLQVIDALPEVGNDTDKSGVDALR